MKFLSVALLFIFSNNVLAQPEARSIGKFINDSTGIQPGIDIAIFLAILGGFYGFWRDRQAKIQEKKAALAQLEFTKRCDLREFIPNLIEDYHTLITLPGRQNELVASQRENLDTESFNREIAEIRSVTMGLHKNLVTARMKILLALDDSEVAQYCKLVDTFISTSAPLSRGEQGIIESMFNPIWWPDVCSKYANILHFLLTEFREASGMSRSTEVIDRFFSAYPEEYRPKNSAKIVKVRL